MSELRHILALVLDEQQMSLLFREGATVRCTLGVPPDAQLLGVWADFAHRAIVVQYEHPSFRPLGFGEAVERRYVGYEVLEHPQAGRYDVIPLKIGMDEREYLDMRRWICERAAEIEGRA